MLKTLWKKGEIAGYQNFLLFSQCSFIRHNSSQFRIPTSNLVCIRMAFILNFQSHDLKHGGDFSNRCEVINLSMTSLARMKVKA